MKLLLTTTMLLLSMGAETQTYTIDTKHPQQTIEHFGASDAWSMQTIGLWPEEEQQQQIADWLFSTENDANGKPKGIGLSLWRFNLGAGSAEQGDSSYINKDTRTECFLRFDGTYDWTRQPGQVKFLKMAKQRGVPYILAFLNSPPVYFTENELATNTGRGGTLNLRPECYDAFAQFMAESVSGLEREHGIHVDYISPINEPDGHWNWQGPKQEGSPATNWEIAEVARKTSAAFTEKGLTTQIMVNESSDLRCLLGVYKTSWERGNAIASFWSKDSTATYLGDTPLVPRLMLAHSYWTNTPVPYMREIREQLRDNMKTWLEAIMPICDEYDIDMCVHPDDPPYEILGLPRIVTDEEDIRWFLNAVPNPHNGLTFCAGSLSAGGHNNLTPLAQEFHNRTHFVHLRSCHIFPDGNFTEASHLGGRADIIELTRIFEQEEQSRKKPLPMRVDHGMTMLGDETKGYNAGYSFLGRMFALGQVQGIIATVDRELGIKYQQPGFFD